MQHNLLNQHQMMLLSEQQQEEKAKLFDQQIKYLNDDLCSREYSIHDEQIKLIYDETKKSKCLKKICDLERSHRKIITRTIKPIELVKLY